MNFSQLYIISGNTALVNDSVLAKQAVNDAIRELIKECGWNWIESPLTNLDAGIAFISLNAKLTPSPLKIHTVRYYGSSATQGDVIEPVTMAEMLDLQAVSNTIGDVAVYAVADTDKMFFYPTPKSGDTAKFYYSGNITDYTNDAAVPNEIPAHLHYCIIPIAARNLALVNNAQHVMEFEPLAMAAIAKCREHASLFKTRRTMRARVGYPRDRALAGNDRYWSGDG